MGHFSGRTIHALVYSGIVFAVGVFAHRSGEMSRAFRWQAFGIATILVYTIFALITMPWINAVVSGALLAIEVAIILQNRRLRD